jgi:hypothetical protein
MAGFMRCTICKITTCRQYSQHSVAFDPVPVFPLATGDRCPVPASVAFWHRVHHAEVMKISMPAETRGPSASTRFPTPYATGALLLTLGCSSPGTRDKSKSCNLLFHGPWLRKSCRRPSSPQSHNTRWTVSVRIPRYRSSTFQTKHTLTLRFNSFDSLEYLTDVMTRYIRTHNDKTTLASLRNLGSPMLHDANGVLRRREHRRPRCTRATEGADVT